MRIGLLVALLLLLGSPAQAESYIGVGFKRSVEWLTFPVRHPIKAINKASFPVRHPLVFAQEAGKTLEPYQPFIGPIISTGTAVILGVKRSN